eukprot:TRINITY_DN4435_c0_g1_i1.p1 TRINITY_DN4435_c0_g1~~TRINITY_DN4435_c0_g1_i1.p1  ORF type:complete len:215 (+),score=23.16 TRINITY_DN4435_c0_g1_i1:46-690(+)
MLFKVCKHPALFWPLSVLVRSNHLFAMGVSAAESKIETVSAESGKAVSTPYGQIHSQQFREFYGNYYYNNDKSMNYVWVDDFTSTVELTEMMTKFPEKHFKQGDPRTMDPSKTLLRIMMAKKMNAVPQKEDDHFIHDTLYNVELDPTGSVLTCATGDLQVLPNKEKNRMQVYGHTKITKEVYRDKVLYKMYIEGDNSSFDESWIMERAKGDENL